MGGWRGGLAGSMLACAVLAAPAAAETARDLLTRASFTEDSKPAALLRIAEAQRLAGNVLQHSPADAEAQLMQATAIGYRAKLTGSRADAIGARKQFEALIARDPRNAEAQMALGAWHVGAVYRLGGFVGRTALGAQKKVGLDSLDRSIALGGNRALFPGLAALLRLELDPGDPRGLALAEAASRAAAPTPLDRVMQRSSVAILVPLRAGDRSLVRALASRLLPFGRLD